MSDERRTRRVAMWHYQYRGYDICGDCYSWSSSRPGRQCSKRQAWVIQRMITPGRIWTTLPGRYRTLAQAREEVDRMIKEGE